MKYNLIYASGDKIMERKNISKEEVDKFLDTLPVGENTSLRVTQVKDNEREDDER